jgi:DNA adenine methylase
MPDILIKQDSESYRIPISPFISPLRYPGSKRRLSGYIEGIIRTNHLQPELFVEPFAGGASVALQLLKRRVVNKIGLIEKDPLVASFWKVVFFDTTWLIKQIQEIDVTIERWHDFKAKESKLQTDRERALACLFLNRTNFSGFMARNVGPLGGRKQASKYKIDCRFSRDTVIKRIEQLSAFENNVSFVWNSCWSEGLNRIREQQQQNQLPHENILFYFDPPFFEQAKQLYAFYFNETDHQLLRDAILTLQEPWILSYDSVEKVKELYRSANSNSVHIEVLYNGSALKGGKITKEVILSNLSNLPQIEIPQNGNGRCARYEVVSIN